MINPRTRLLAAAMFVAAPACAHGQERLQYPASAGRDACPALAREIVELGAGPMSVATDVTVAARSGGNIPEAITNVGPQVIGMLAGIVGVDGETRLTRLTNLEQRYEAGCQKAAI